MSTALAVTAMVVGILGLCAAFCCCLQWASEHHWRRLALAVIGFAVAGSLVGWGISSLESASDNACRTAAHGAPWHRVQQYRSEDVCYVQYPDGQWSPVWKW
jgi:hypothetical protein